MLYLKTAGGYLCKIAVCAFVYAAGLVTSRIVLAPMGIRPPRMPEQADEAVAVYYLLVGSVILAAGLAPLAARMRGSPWTRWSILALFLFVSFGINNSLEDSIYSRTGGAMLMVPILFLPCLLFAGILTLLFQPRSKEEPLQGMVSRFFGGRDPGEWAWRILAGIFAFPVVYFTFGIVVSPIVVDYYRQGVSDLALPDVGVILGTSILRSILFLLSSLPILLAWSGSRRRIILSLGSAFFVLVATFEIVLAYQLPWVLRVTHTIEILVDSLVYAWLLATLLSPAVQRAPSTKH